MKMKTFIEKVAAWLKANQLALIYFVFAIAIEMVAVFSVEKNAFMSRPFLLLGLLIFITGGLLLIPDDRIRLPVGALFLVAQVVIDLIFAALFDMTGQYFEFSLLNLRNDAVAALEKIPVNFLVFYVGLFCCVAYIVYGLRLIRGRDKSKKKGKTSKKPFFFYAGTVLVGVATLFGSFFAYYPQNTNKYEEMVMGKSTSVYASYGMLGNLIGEVGTTIRGDRSTMSNDQIEDFIYGKKSGGEFNSKYVSNQTEFFGKSKDKNVVVILSESFEWYSFMRSEAFYDSPNALAFTEEQLAALYPNLTRFYNESVVATNFHSREKTDASETLTILGCYPTEKYITYDYYDVTMPQTMPNVMKLFDTDIQARSFHNGEKTFYNREVTHKTFGFEGLTDRFDMADKANVLYEEQKKALIESGKTEEAEKLTPIFTDYKEKYDEMNLDSEMIEICKDEMFPADKRFYTYITTISMHGAYYNRRSLADERAEVESVLGANLPKTSDEKGNILLHYMVTAKEFDDAVGCIYADLESKNLLDKTTILMFGDHNAYYNELSNYVKDIDGYKTDRKFTDMYKVPLMIRDSDLTQAVQDKWQTRFIDKFTCTSDVMPTLLDLLGIRYFKNLYYGHSIFDYQTQDKDKDGIPDKDENGKPILTPVESVLYSRSYDIFVFEGIVGRSVITHLYKQDGLSAGRIQGYENEARELVEKIKHCDYIFKQDYFATPAKKQLFQDNLMSINTQKLA